MAKSPKKTHEKPAKPAKKKFFKEIAVVDADKFKQINTRFGHLTGDFVLAEIAEMLKSSTRGSDAVVRYGGDEFLILLADTTSEGASNVVGRIEGKLKDWNAADQLEGDGTSLVGRQPLLGQRHQLPVDPGPEHVTGLDVKVRRPALDGRLDDLFHEIAAT